MTRPALLLTVLVLLAACEAEAGAWNLSQDFGALEGAAGPVDVWVGPGIDVGATHEAVTWLNETAGAECFAVVEQAWPWPEMQGKQMPLGAVSVDVDRGMYERTEKVGNASWRRGRRFAGSVTVDPEAVADVPVLIHELLHIAYADYLGHVEERGVFGEKAWGLDLPDAYVSDLRAACASRQ